MGSVLHGQPKHQSVNEPVTKSPAEREAGRGELGYGLRKRPADHGEVWLMGHEKPRAGWESGRGEVRDASPMLKGQHPDSTPIGRSRQIDFRGYRLRLLGTIWSS